MCCHTAEEVDGPAAHLLDSFGVARSASHDDQEGAEDNAAEEPVPPAGGVALGVRIPRAAAAVGDGSAPALRVTAARAADGGAATEGAEEEGKQSQHEQHAADEGAGDDAVLKVLFVGRKVP